MSDLSKLEEHSESLLLAETGALLHNLGKVSSKFLKHQLKIDNADFLYQHILNLIDPFCPHIPAGLWDKCRDLPQSDILDIATKQALSGNPFTFSFPFNDRVYVPGDLIEYLGQKEPWYGEHNDKLGILYIFPNGSLLTHLMNRAHRGASGGEKEYIYSEQQPNGHNLWQATPFGWERPAPSISDVDDVRLQVEKAIQQHFENRPSPHSLEQFSRDLLPNLSKVIADTRRPHNDVTVWDIGHTGMTFLVTQAISCILTHRPLEHAELCNIESQNTLFWRVLSVRTDGLRYLEEVSTLADLRVRKHLLEQTLEQVQHKLERNFLAIQVYQDENGSFYIYPDFENLSESIFTVVKSVLSPLVEIDGRIVDVKLSPNSLVSHPKDEGGKYVGEFIREHLSKAPSDKTDPELIVRTWTGSFSHAEICPACGIRPQGYGSELVPSYHNNPKYYSNKARIRNLCCLCMHRRSGVAEQWVSQVSKDVDSGTVWIDEVADENGRVALIVGNLPAEQFMCSVAYPHSGSSSTKKQFHHRVEWIGSPPTVGSTVQIGNKGQFEWTGTVLIGDHELRGFKSSNLKIHHPNKMDVFLNHIQLDGNGNIIMDVHENLAYKFKINDPVHILGRDFTVVDIHRLKTANNDSKQKIMSTVLWNDNNSERFFWVRNAREIEVFETEGKAARNDSFARLRRIWETTHHFWQEVCPNDEVADLAQSLIGQNLTQKECRLVIKPNDADELDLGFFHAYDLVLPKGVRMGVVWDSGKKCFITCDNLDHLATKEQLDKSVQSVIQKGSTFTVEEPVGYGAKTKVWGTVEIEEIDINNSTYTPVIPILAEPRTFMALVPADKALQVVEAIKAKYEREMGKVRNRLPLHLGIIYAGRRTPLRAVLSAGRRMLKQEALGDAGSWKVMEDVIENNDPMPDKVQALTDGSNQFDMWFEVHLRHQLTSRELTWYVPSVMGDGTSEDRWYPYVFWKQDKNDCIEPAEVTDSRSRYFQAPNPWNKDDSGNLRPDCFVHAGELKAGDIVYFTPATLDFQWLDSAGRRFEIAYNAEGDAQGQRRNLSRRPYLLDELGELGYIWETLKHHLSKNQIYALRDLIEAKRVEWQVTKPELAEFDLQGKLIRRSDDVFWQFCYDSLANAEWSGIEENDRESWFSLWANHAARGWFSDVVELHLQIMKEEVQDEF